MPTENTTNPYKSPQVYWCAVCDALQVDSTKPETGTFYQVWGHAYDDGDYHSVFFAICPDCKIEDNCKPVTKDNFDLDLSN